MTAHKRSIALSKVSRVLPKYSDYDVIARNGDIISIHYYIDRKDYWRNRPKSRRVHLHSMRSVILGWFLSLGINFPSDFILSDFHFQDWLINL